VRATRLAGLITVTARSTGLRPASVTLTSLAFDAPGGVAPWAPTLTSWPLPATPPRAGFGPGPPTAAQPAPAGMAGRFTRAFNYSGPSASIAHVETGARNGRNVYVDGDMTFVDLPEGLAGADWAQVGRADASYHAVDLIEIAVLAGTTVTVAHDDRLPRPAWLLRLFEASPASITVAGQPMTLFTRRVPREESLTLGPNVDTAAGAANMYVVFVAGPR
jgi:beta-galactosidase